MGEADRLLTLLTLQRGKVRAVAKGARKPSARKTGMSNLFNCVELQIAVAREMDIVIQAQTVEPFLRLRDDLDRLSYAYYFAELVDRFVERGNGASRDLRAAARRTALAEATTALVAHGTTVSRCDC